MNIFWKNGWTIDYDQDDNSKSYKNCEKLIDQYCKISLSFKGNPLYHEGNLATMILVFKELIHNKYKRYFALKKAYTCVFGAIPLQGFQETSKKTLI